MSRRSLLAGAAAALADMMAPGRGLAEAAGTWIKPGLWASEAAALAKAAPVKNPEIVCRTNAGRTILTLPGPEHAERPLVLNDCGAVIWDACDGRQTATQIAQNISRQFDISKKQAYLDCLSFLFHLKLFDAIFI